MSWMVTDAGRVALDVEASPSPTPGRRPRPRASPDGDDLRLVADLAGDQRRGRAGHRRRPAAVGAEAERGLVGVAVDDLDVVRRDAELLGDDLGERRLVALALGLHREPHDGLAGRVDPQLAAVGHAEAEDVHVLARPGADGLGEERDADAHQLAALALLRLLARAARRSRPSPCAWRMRRLVVAGVVDPAGLATCTGTARAAAGSAAAARPGPSSARTARQSTIRSTR